MTEFSANLGFLWNDRPLAEAIHAAKAAGFSAVECHWPYEENSDDVKDALDQTGLTMLGLNTRRGNVGAGDNGLSAIPDRIDEARAAIDEALAYANKINTKNIHVMAGFAAGDDAHQTFVENLSYACDKAAEFGITILIEPLNHYDAPGYFLQTTEQAKKIIEQVSKTNLKLMFDCYHIQLMEGDLGNRFKKLQPIIGHVQFASVPDRGTPDHGEVNYSHVFAMIKDAGYSAPLGAEYKPTAPTEETLGWMGVLR